MSLLIAIQSYEGRIPQVAGQQYCHDLDVIQCVNYNPLIKIEPKKVIVA